MSKTSLERSRGSGLDEDGVGDNDKTEKMHWTIQPKTQAGSAISLTHNHVASSTWKPNAERNLSQHSLPFKFTHLSYSSQSNI